jgi:hypothetical protein
MQGVQINVLQVYLRVAGIILDKFTKNLFLKGAKIIDKS